MKMALVEVQFGLEDFRQSAKSRFYERSVHDSVDILRYVS